MNAELDSILCSKYPEIFRDRHASPKHTAMCWGIDCGDGWYTLIDALCDHLQRTQKYQQHQVVATQVKEKYGRLRFYVDSATDEQRGAIDFAEHMSSRICDVCGNPGQDTGTHWIATRCSKHEEPRQGAA